MGKKLGVKILWSLFLLTLSSQSFGSLSTDPFFQRFELKRNDQGQIETIRISENEKWFSFEGYYTELRNDLLRALSYGQNESTHESLGEVFDKEFADSLESLSFENRSIVKHSLNKLAQTNVLGALNDSHVQFVLEKFRQYILDHISGFQILAQLDDPYFFYTRDIAEDLINWGLSLTEKYVEGDLKVRIAVYIIKNIVSYLQERRFFYQNMLLYYLEAFEPASLEMTADEVAKTRSSIYETKIRWLYVFEARRAAKNWLNYGNQRFNQDLTRATEMLEYNRDWYAKINERYNFAFQVVTKAGENGHRLIINLHDPRFWGAPWPSETFDFDAPQKVENQRHLLRLAQLGLSFIALPTLITSVIDWFIESMYVYQSRTEGALVGYLEAHGLTEQAQLILNQNLNPFLM